MKELLKDKRSEKLLPAWGNWDLNHDSGSRSGSAGIYQRHNYFHEKKSALAAWEKEVRRLARADKLNGMRKPIAAAA